MSPPRAEPMYFGGARPLFGWLHRSAPAGARDLGVVLVPPFGQEAISSHRTLRHLAEEAAAAGLPALRFDLDGTGDSAGDDRDAGLLPAWIAAVHAAVEALRARTGVARVALFGVRLGAALAALAAAEREDVAALVALAPVVAGRAYLRELRMLDAARRPVEAEALPEGLEGAAGFALGAELRAAVGGIDLTRLGRRPAEEVLLIERSDFPGDGRLAARLGALGARVTVERHPGYVEMLLDAHATVVPRAILDATVAWLGERAGVVPAVVAAAGIEASAAVAAGVAASAAVAAGVAASAAVAAGVAASAAVAAGVAASAAVAGSAAVAAPVAVARFAGPDGVALEETALFLDPERLLFGIVTAPAAGAPRGKALLLLNAGAVHRAGPCRLSTVLARRWAAQGHVVLRFDLSGLGDSRARPGEPENAPYGPRAPEDIAVALAYLGARPDVAQRQVVGLCSGAYHALRAAVGGAPIDGAVLINPLTFFWKAGQSLEVTPHQVASESARYARTMRSPEAWKRLLRGEVEVRAAAGILARRAVAVAAGPARDVARALGRPLAEDLGADLLAAAARGVDLRFVFSAADPGLSLLRTQGGTALGALLRRGRVEIDVIRGADHTFTPLLSQERLAEVLDRVVA
jgi:pimeloyl-ACP methyl ester carboxylesterase